MKRFITLAGRLLANSCIVLCSLGIALLLAEWVVRSWMPSPDYGVGKRPAIRNQLFMYDEQLGWKGSPNARSVYISKDFIVNVSHDAFGYRNQNPPFVPGKRNILLLGDSYAWGWGVEDNETASAVLNRENHEFNAYNIGIPAYGTDQQYLALQRLLADQPDFHYDHVVVLFYMNDFFDNTSALASRMYPKPFFLPDNAGKLQLHNVPVPRNELPPVDISEPPPEQSLVARSQLFNLTIDSLGKLLFELTSDPDPAAGKPVILDEEEERAIVMTGMLLQQIRDFCRPRGTSFHVVFLMTINTDEKPILMIRRLAERLQQQHIPHSFFQSRLFPRTDLWLDAHYTPYGQKQLAHHIADILQEKPGR